MEKIITDNKNIISKERFKRLKEIRDRLEKLTNETSEIKKFLRELINFEDVKAKEIHVC